MPTTEEEVAAQFTGIAKEEGLITNTSKMSPFWRLVTSIVSAPVMWLIDALSYIVMPNLFLATASGVFVDMFAWAVNLARKPAGTAAGTLLFAKSDIGTTVTVPVGTVVQTERINDVVYSLITAENFVIAAGVLNAQVPVVAEAAGSAYNLAPGYYKILPVAIAGIASAENAEDWLTTPGTEQETDDELRDRTKNQFNLVGNYHIDAVYRGMIASLAGMTTDRIYFEHGAPRGPGTANVYLLLDAGVASQPYIDAVNDYVMDQGNHGHGDDVLCLALPETPVDLTVTIYPWDAGNLTEEQLNTLLQGATHLVRCAFRENSLYDVAQTWPWSRFSLSRLGEELHDTFPEIESVEFSRGDILSELEIARLGTLQVVTGG
ncbi:hypothetical protein D8682_05765 [Buttiauxella sp. 3AFRM03]|uniref:baseplate J/gp47 family protein n=1 Tax=Buttiauxella sp. 3AFRM03 TaxID=2479367 RepID=UPI000EF7DE03|nr:baseplate J/gp47 family protein [Buttiauxella sp. 3AFRM03]AYN30280.1 hypothetical protein D8682_05765 [Buttiauxella sp. 3AFRM03]